jgi:hypothetical protein
MAIAGSIRGEGALATVLACRNDVAIAEWINGPSGMFCWNEFMTGQELFEAIDVNKFDLLSAGKQSSQERLEKYAPCDFRKEVNRNTVLFIWGDDADAVLTKCTRPMTNGEAAQGYSLATTGGVTAAIASCPGGITVDDVSRALNKF